MRRANHIVFDGLFVAIAVVLPIFFHWLGVAGSVFLPMHIPVLLAGLIMGTRTGFLTGLVSPFISCLLTGMPPLWPVLPIMTVELMTYGAVAGYLRRRHYLAHWLALVGAMTAGRLAAGAAVWLLSMTLQLPIKPEVYVVTALVTGVPGVFIQLLFLPLLASKLEKISGLRKEPDECASS
ncbi:MAG TPA: ECF transporter S component [Patescibacteria group bacterium]|nr:ECF transporter S component [Patescibacteria group bacterium]